MKFMKSPISKLNEVQIKSQFPIVGSTPGWFFKIEEVANGVYRAEGTDLYGRAISCDGHNPDSLLERCNKDASEIQAQIK